MKKKIILCVLVFVLLITFLVPYKLTKGFFSSSMETNIPASYINKIPKFYFKDHLYSIVSDEMQPISLFKNEYVDFITVQINFNKEDGLITYLGKPSTIENESYEVFKFTNSEVLNFYNEINKYDNKINNINFKGENIKLILKNQNLNIFEFSSDFEILLNKIRFFYVATDKVMYVILKKTNNNSQLYIIEIKDKANVNNILRTLE